MSNRTIIQYFEWYLPADQQHWVRAAQDAAHLAKLGFTDVWLPPAFKGHTGSNDVGYGVYDLYDLGEFDQKGSIPTKYGTKDEYLAAVEALHAQGLSVMADMVLNHRMGADFTQDTTGTKVDDGNRLRPLVENKNLTVWTGFDFPGRGGKYSDFVWTKAHFSSVDWNEQTQANKIFKLSGHLFSKKVSPERGNYDYLMGADVDYRIPEVVEEITRWGKWYLDFTGVDSLRLDAVKHISHAMFPYWLAQLREHSGRELFAVGEYWMDNLYYLMRYLDDCGHCMNLFDVPLHYQFERAAKAGNSFDLRRIYDNTLALHAPDHAVTLVDNHDTQLEQALESWVQGWFKPLAYALILLREEGTPCVFYGDLYGIPHNNIPPVRQLETLLMARQEYGFGLQEDYFDHPNVVGWTRSSGMAVVISNGDDGWKDMELGTPGQVFVDLLGNRQEEVVIREDGFGTFFVRSHSVSVWVPKE